MLDGLLRLLHPFVPFVTDTLWTSLTGEESLVIADWPAPSGRVAEPVAADWVGDVQTLATEIRRARADQKVPPGRSLPAADHRDRGRSRRDGARPDAADRPRP